MFGSLLKLLLTAILLVSLFSAPVHVAFASGMAPSTGARPATITNMPAMAEMGGMQAAGGDCCMAAELLPADCSQTCPLVFGCVSQSLVAIADHAGLRAWLPPIGVVVWPFRDRHRSGSPAAGPYEPPRA